jgi:hypothetical protein
VSISLPLSQCSLEEPVRVRGEVVQCEAASVRGGRRGCSSASRSCSSSRPSPSGDGEGTPSMTSQRAQGGEGWRRWRMRRARRRATGGRACSKLVDSDDAVISNTVSLGEATQRCGPGAEPDGGNQRRREVSCSWREWSALGVNGLSRIA